MQSILKATSASRGLILKTVEPSKACMSTVHNDMEVPDFSYYRRSDTKLSTSKPRDSVAKRHNFSYLMAGATGVTMAYSATTVVNHLVSTLSASKDVLAMAQIEVNLADIPEGKNMTFKWRGKPLFIRHRFWSKPRLPILSQFYWMTLFVSERLRRLAKKTPLMWHP
jgi:ubiquinol-cytochrome c reductase iron-sulfur subunit